MGDGYVSRGHLRGTYMPTLEKSIEDYFVAQIKKVGGEHIKIEKRAHWPDRLVVMPWVGVFLVELKKPKIDTTSEGQAMLHNKLAAIGTKVWKLHTKADVDNFIQIHKVL
jgi:hypothetical protein